MRRGNSWAFTLYAATVLVVTLAAGLVAVAAAGSTEAGAGPARVAVDAAPGSPAGAGVAGLATPAQPGDDEVTVNEEIDSVQLVLAAPVAPVEEEVDVRAVDVHHPGFRGANQMLDALAAANPDAAQAARARFASEGIYLHWDLAPNEAARQRVPTLSSNDSAGPFPWPSRDRSLGTSDTAGFDDETAYVRPTVANSTDNLVARAGEEGQRCWGRAYTSALIGEDCATRRAPVPWADLPTVLPSAGVRFHLDHVSVFVGGTATQEALDAGAAASWTRPHAPGFPGMDRVGEGLTLRLPDGPFVASKGAIPPREAGATPEAGLSAWLLPDLLGFAVGLPAPWYLYHRLERGDLLRNPTRAAILARVQSHPGEAQHDVARALRLQHTLVDYHTRHLANHGLITTRHVGGQKCFFPGTVRSDGEPVLRSLLKRGRTREVIAAVAQRPGTNLSDVAAQTGMSASSVHWHLARLQGAGLVTAQREGRAVALHVPAGQRETVARLLDIPTEGAPLSVAAPGPESAAG